MGLLIGEVARRAGLSTSALRYYEKAGLLPPPSRVAKRRVYDSKVLGRIHIILLALDAGFTVKETRTFLSGYPVTTTPAERWRTLASKKLAELDEQMTRLKQMKSILDESFQCACLRLEDCEECMPPAQRIS
ncbi:MAG TPA: MerR family transcriptional regulator [Steroidobacteraceae bacterium]|jgi:MerR family redox-sensitive transcriptional activator SoxR|nr:MerR family transcriptional regulator [Steroidobacteraceae bacterium]